MTPAFRVGRILGIDVRVHVTFLALVILLVAWQLLPDADGGVITPLVILGLFVLAGLHELGHALVARRLGVEVEDILVLPVLLMVRLRLPENPRIELAVASAGPAVNLVLAALMLATLPVLGLPAGSFAPWPPTTLLGLLFWVNLLMGTLNLLPAFPMDGGRILRASLARRLGYLRATRIANRVGWVLVLVGGTVGLVVTGNLIFPVVAAFLVILGWREEQAVRVRAELRELRDLREHLCELARSGSDSAVATPFGDLDRLRDPVFRETFERYRERLESLRAQAVRDGSRTD
jgi:stage IV sporulation protein FB